MTMTPGEIYAYNMRYHGLTLVEELARQRLMEMPIRDMPNSCAAMLDKAQKKQGLCGEVLADATARWIKKQRWYRRWMP